MTPQLFELRSNEQTDEPSRSVTSHTASKQNTQDHGVFCPQKTFVLMDPSLIAPRSPCSSRPGRAISWKPRSPDTRKTSTTRNTENQRTRDTIGSRRRYFRPSWSARRIDARCNCDSHRGGPGPSAEGITCRSKSSAALDFLSDPWSNWICRLGTP